MDTTTVTGIRSVPGARRRAAALAVALLTTLGLDVSADERLEASGLAEARALYQAARFDEALSALDRFEQADGDGGPAPSADEREAAAECRALCLLALERAADARLVVETILATRIAYQPRSDDLPPRFVAMVGEARGEVWRARVRAEYAAGRASYDVKAFAEARAHLGKVVALMGEETVPAPVRESLADLGALARDFLALAEAAAAPPRPAPPPPAPPATSRAIYSAGDAGVAPPVALRRDIPSWRAAGEGRRFLRHVERGLLEVVIDERGNVEAARLTSPVHPLYDSRLLTAARAWRYKPATRDGVPVRFRSVIEIQLTPQ